MILEVFYQLCLFLFRYKKKVPSSRMFWPLFRYIGGVNAGLHQVRFVQTQCKINPLTGNVKIEMTKGVTTKHTLEKKDKFGEIELQEMCFYLENKFQVRAYYHSYVVVYDDISHFQIDNEDTFQQTLGSSEPVPAPSDPKVCAIIA